MLHNRVENILFGITFLGMATLIGLALIPFDDNGIDTYGALLSISRIFIDFLFLISLGMGWYAIYLGIKNTRQ